MSRSLTTRLGATALATSVAAIGLVGLTTAPAQAESVISTTSFAYTGSDQSFTVPSGVRLLKVVANGAGGGGSPAYGGAGGSGAKVTSYVAVTPGEVLTVKIGGGGIGARAGGGDNLRNDASSRAEVAGPAGGGGGSTVIQGTNLLIVAGGGGGGEKGVGGSAGQADGSGAAGTATDTQCGDTVTYGGGGAAGAGGTAGACVLGGTTATAMAGKSWADGGNGGDSAVPTGFAFRISATPSKGGSTGGPGGASGSYGAGGGAGYGGGGGGAGGPGGGGGAGGSIAPAPPKGAPAVAYETTGGAGGGTTDGAQNGGDGSVEISVIGRAEQEPVTSLGLPKKVKPGTTTTLVKKSVKTNAGNTVKVRVTCQPRLLLVPAGDVTCSVTKKKNGAVSVTTPTSPVTVTVIATAPGNDSFKPYKSIKRYRVG